jgi:hypothetical protein
VLWDDHAQLRTLQQEEAVRLAVAKQRPLVANLPVGGGKSLIFMVPTVPPYAKLKKQLVLDLQKTEWPCDSERATMRLICKSTCISLGDLELVGTDLNLGLLANILVPFSSSSKT